MDLVLRDHHDLFWGETADSYESAIRGFWDGEITLNLSVILHFSQIEILFFRKILLTLAGMDTFRLWKKWIQICYPFSLLVVLLKKIHVPITFSS